MDKNKKWPLSDETQDQLNLLGHPASYNDLLVTGLTESQNSTVLVDETDSVLVFLYKGVWRCLGTNGL